MKNDTKLKGVISKDKARAQELQDAIAKANERAQELKEAIGNAEKRIEELRPALTAEQEQTAIAEQGDYADLRKRAAERVRIIRKDLSLMPPNALLTTDKWAIGAVGLLPQWPLGLFANFNILEQQSLQATINGIARGIAPNPLQLKQLERLPGGIQAAKKKANVRVVQVADDLHLLCAWLDTDYLFLYELADTSGHVDDEVLRLEGLAVVCDTARYVSVSGAVRTVFVLRMVTADELPPMADN